MTVMECIKCKSVMGCGETLRTMTKCNDCNNCICDNMVTSVRSRFIDWSSGLCAGCFAAARAWNKGLVFVGEYGA